MQQPTSTRFFFFSPPAHLYDLAFANVDGDIVFFPGYLYKKVHQFRAFAFPLSIMLKQFRCVFIIFI